MFRKVLSIVLSIVLILSTFIIAPFSILAVDTEVSSTGGTNGTTGECIWSVEGTVLTISGYGKMEDYQYKTRNMPPWMGFEITSVVIEEGVTGIGTFAFYGLDKLTNVMIADTVTEINGWSFEYCTGLKSIIIPDSVKYIGPYSFYEACNLAEIDYPEWIVVEDKTVFEGTPWYENFYNNRAAGVIYIGHTALTTKGDCPDRIEIKDGTELIGEKTFNGCKSLISITIPKTVTRIGLDAFGECDNLESVYISDIASWCSVDFVQSLFEYCSSNPLSYAHNLYLNGILVTDLVIPDSVTNIGEYAFDGCRCLTSVTIPDSITNIKDNAFRACTNLSSISIPNSVESIGNATFKSCTNIANVTIPNSVNSIGISAFQSCKSLTSITLPNSVTIIGDSAFAYCLNLIIIDFPDSVLDIGTDAFYETAWYNSQSNGLVYAGKTAYKMKGKSPEEIVIKDGTSNIADSAFWFCSNLSSVTIPDSVNSIGSMTFRGCKDLTNITIGNSVTSIKSYAFQNCTSLTSVTIPDSVTSIGYAAFYGCISLTNLTIGNSVTSIRHLAFWNCTKLTSVTIPASVKLIGEDAFGYYYDENRIKNKIEGFTIYGNTGSEAEKYANENGFLFVPIDTKTYEYTVLINGTAMITKYTGNDANLTIPNEIDGYIITEIGNSAFWDCNTLTSVTIPEGVTSIGNQAFMWCENLSEINLPSTVTHVGYSAFSQTAFMNNYSEDTVVYCGNVLCEITGFDDDTKLAVKDGTTVIADNAAVGATNITKISFPNSLKTIGKRAFKGCRELTSISWSDSITTIGDSAFEECSNVNIDSLPSDLEYLGNSAFCYCWKLESMTMPDSVTVILGGTFFDCKNMKSIYLPKALTEIGSESIGYNLTNKNTVEKATDFTIYGYSGTIAEQYAENNGFAFVSLDDEENTILGDVDGVESITVVDATFIQRHVASIPIPFVLDETVADTDGDGIVSIMDATYIQRWLANLKANDNIGKPI